MAVAAAFGKILAEPAVGIISSFLQARSVAATCGTNASDMATLADIMNIPDAPFGVRTLPYLHEWVLYQDSLELQIDWV